MLVDNVGLVGSCINILPRKSEIYTLYESRHGESESLSHVQTMVYAMSRNVLKYLYDEGFYAIDEKIGKEEVIRDYEVRLSRLVIRNGWNIKCLLPEYNDIDYRTAHSDINPTSNYGDPNWKFGYFGRTVHPFEAMFIKINRNIYEKQYLDRLAYSMMHKSSYMENSHHLKMPRLNEYMRLIENLRQRRRKYTLKYPMSLLWFLFLDAAYSCEGAEFSGKSQIFVEFSNVELPGIHNMVDIDVYPQCLSSPSIG